MKTYILLLMVLSGSLRAHAQVVDSLDNLILKIPTGWEIEKHATYTALTKYSNSPKSFCQVAIYQQQPASGNQYANFKTEWDGLVLAYFETGATPAPQLRKTKFGNVLYYGAQVTNKQNRLPYYTELHVYDCGNYVQSVLVTSGSKKHLALYDSLWKPIIVSIKKGSINAEPVAGNTSTSNPFNGKWAKSGSSDNGIDAASIITYAGYYKCQYDFKPDGTYTLHGEMRTNTNTYVIIDESGSYKINGAQFTITSSKGTLKKIDRNGKLQRTESIEPVKRAYAWQLHYFEGLDETQLVLTPAKLYTWDGGIGGNSLFPNSLLFSQQFKPEWQYK